jgi:hypothetical protein
MMEQQQQQQQQQQVLILQLWHGCYDPNKARIPDPFYGTNILCSGPKKVTSSSRMQKFL